MNFVLTQCAKYRFGAVVQSCPHVVHAQFEIRLCFLVSRQIGFLNELLMNLNRFFNFTSAPKQVSQGDMRLEWFMILFENMSDCRNGFVSFLIQKIIKTSAISSSQRPCIIGQVFTSVMFFGGKPAGCRSYWQQKGHQILS